MRSLVPLALAMAVPALVYSFLTFDRLVRAEYEHDRAAWEADGKPRGFFWRAPGDAGYATPWSIHRLSVQWLFTTPAWTARAPDSRRALKHLRLAVGAWGILIALAALLVPLTMTGPSA